MKSKALQFLICFTVIISSCSKTIEYTEEFKNNTTGKYLYNQDDIIKVYYENNKLYLNWRGGMIEPVALDQNEFFVADIYKKLHFVEHPETKKRYLSIISEETPEVVSYDYIKVPDSYKTPSAYLKEGNYEEALKGFLEIKKQDSTSIFIAERDFNNIGYQHLRKKEYDKAIEVFKINIALHPTSDNVYDSLADAYLRTGDSLQAFTYYNKALEYNTGNRKALRFMKIYKPKDE